MIWFLAKKTLFNKIGFIKSYYLVRLRDGATPESSAML
jgi:hypothetical protein